MATTRRPRQDIKADSRLVEQLDGLKEELGTSSRTSTIRRLVVHYKESSKSREGLPVATASIMTDDRPALITGSSGAGKTTTIKALLDGWAGPVFALDVKGVDYVDFEKLDLGKVSSYEWASVDGPTRLRFTPTTELSAQGESEAILQLLALILHQDGHPLKSWVLILEEGQRFAKNSNFKEILSEGRVFCRKILIASQLSRPFRELVPVYVPPPRPV